MTDIRTIWSAGQLMGDWLIEPPDLAHDHDLETAVLISLFTDRLADADDVLPDNTGDRRGWWGDTTPEPPQEHIGSKLWLLIREKATNQVRLRAEDYARDALAWMIEDGVADKVDVAAAWIAFQQLQITVDIWRDGKIILQGRYARFWAEELADAIERPS